MTTWTSIADKAHEYFGFRPDMVQMRMWWFGAVKKPQAEKYAAKNWAMREIGEWDVVIKLAMLYTWQMKDKANKKMSTDEICSFVYWLLWHSPQVRVMEAKDKNGKVFMGLTFWGWAVENRKKFSPVVSAGGIKKIKQALKNMMEVLGE